MKFFGTRKNAEKTRKTQKNAQKTRKISRILKLRTALLAPTRTQFADANSKRTRCVADADYLPTSALSRSQHKLEEDSTDDVITAVAMIGRHVSTLSGASVELTTKDLQQWTKVYKEGKGHVAAFMKLRQGQKYEDFYLTPSGLMARMVGGRQKIIVAKFCDSKY